MSQHDALGLSTAWNGTRHANVDAIVEEHRRLGFSRLEAYCHFTPAQLRQLQEAARGHGVQITSLHSPCPVPVNAEQKPAAWGDWLASTSQRERLYAVDAMKRTIDAAAALDSGPRGVVIHLGHTGVVSRQRLIFDTIAEHGRLSEPHRRLLEDAWREREASKAPHLDAALDSIRALGEYARGTDVRLGVETRDGYHEIPSLDEVADVLAGCKDLPVYYWHDAGHGAKLDFAGFVQHEEYLRRYGDRMLGMHIHDTRGPRDHQAPGQGDTDFAMLARYLRPETIKTLELHSSTTAEQIAEGLELLAEIHSAAGVRRAPGNYAAD